MSPVTFGKFPNYTYCVREIYYFQRIKTLKQNNFQLWFLKIRFKIIVNFVTPSNTIEKDLYFQKTIAKQTVYI